MKAYPEARAKWVKKEIPSESSRRGKAHANNDLMTNIYIQVHIFSKRNHVKML